jgi:predicted heme/steroid binding protein/uncharacterized membrane protein
VQKEFNQESLAEFNGRDGRLSYIARDGVVYDVSDSRLWQNGEHMKRHHAGLDLSADFSAAPHGPEVLERVARIGSIAFMFAVPLFSLLAFVTGKASFESTAFHCLGAGLLFTPLTIGTGFFTWWLNYHAKLSLPIKIKIIGSMLLMLLILILFTWRYMVPDILFADGGPGTLYLLLLFSLIPLVGVVGWYGAHLTFPVPKKK